MSLWKADKESTRLSSEIIEMAGVKENTIHTYDSIMEHTKVTWLIGYKTRDGNGNSFCEIIIFRSYFHRNSIFVLS